MLMHMRRRYLAGPDPEKMKGKAWKGRRAGGSHGGSSGVKGSKGQIHPIGLSGRACGKLIQSFRPRGH